MPSDARDQPRKHDMRPASNVTAHSDHRAPRDESRTPASDIPRPFGWLEIGLWFALVFGLAEVAILTVQYLGLGKIINRSIYYVWMTPASYLIVMMIPAAVLAGVGRLWARARRLESGVWVFVLVGVTSITVLLLLKRIHNWALILLVLGVAVQGTRAIVKRRVGFCALVRKTTPWLVAVVAGLGLTEHGWKAWSEKRTLAGLEFGVGTQPNVLLIMFDTVRGANLGLYGYERSTTPQLERLAASGIVFERALSPSPWTLPAHSSMFTGRLPMELSADWFVPLDDEYPTIAEVLADQGYTTAGFVGNLDYGTYQHGLNRGFIHYEDYRISLGEIFLSSGMGRWIGEAPALRPLIGTDQRLGFKTAERVTNDFLDWVRRPRSQPFFAFLNFYDAHDPYLPPDRWYRMFDPERPNRLSRYERGDLADLTDDQIASEMAAYDGAIAYMDYQLGRLIKELSVLGLDSNTIMIVTSDHGEEFGEHGLFRHGHSLYANQLWVPLVISFPPHVPAGIHVQYPVSLQDIALTVLDLVDVPAGPTFRGSSLTTTWSDSSRTAGVVISELRGIENGPQRYPFAHGDMQSVVRENRHYIVYGTGVVEVFDWLTDLAEQAGSVAGVLPRAAVTGN